MVKSLKSGIIILLIGTGLYGIIEAGPNELFMDACSIIKNNITMTQSREKQFYYFLQFFANRSL